MPCLVFFEGIERSDGCKSEFRRNDYYDGCSGNWPQFSSKIERTEMKYLLIIISCTCNVTNRKPSAAVLNTCSVNETEIAVLHHGASKQASRETLLHLTKSGSENSFPF